METTNMPIRAKEIEVFRHIKRLMAFLRSQFGPLIGGE
jgi:hypothetical protein